MPLRVISTEPPHPSTKPVPRPGGAEEGCWCSGDSPHARGLFSPFSQPKEGNWYQLRASSAAESWQHISSEFQPCSQTRNRNFACCRWFIWNFFSFSLKTHFISALGDKVITFDKDHSNSRHRAASPFSCVQAGSPATCLKICGNHSFPAFLGLWSNPWGSLYCTLSSAVFCPSICFLLIQLYWLSWLKQHTCP